VLFPAFVAAKNNLAELKRMYLLAQGVQSLLGIAAGVGLALVAHEAVLVLLGTKWLFVVPFVQMLALANVVESITTSGRYVLLTMGKIRSTALVSWLQVFFFATGAFLVLPDGDALQLASLRVVAVLAEFFVSIWLLMRTLNNVSLPDILRTVWRPLLATGVMALSVIFIGETIQLGPLAELILKIATGMVAFPAAILLLWWATGKPAGAESYLLDKLEPILARRRKVPG
jgi:O-antigen/teichoic acid export membrane protein